MKLLVILQNPYGVNQDYRPSYDVEAFATSHTGKRLKEALPASIDCEIINANPKNGATVDSYLPPDVGYVRNKIEEYKPNIILACGVAARYALKNLDIKIPALYMPHPAYRALSKQITGNIRKELETWMQLN